MKINKYCYVILTLTALSGCQKSAVDQGIKTPQPFIRQIGAAIPGKLPASSAIGPEGGTLISTDRKISLTIPQGAVAATTMFEIQEVNNTLEGNNKPCYKLSPENISFSKAIQLKFNYTGLELSGTTADLLSPAYQDAKGVFYAVRDYVNDRNVKTITLSTTHFSTWTLYDRYRIAGPDEVGTNGTIALKMMTYPALLPLTGKEPTLLEWDEAVVDHPVTGIDPILKTAGWKLEGEGGLLPQGLKSVYGAPSNLPVANPVMVSVSLTGKFEQNGPANAKYILLHPVTIVSDEYFTATIDGVKHNVFQATFAKLKNSFVLTGLVDNKNFITLTVNTGSSGTFKFGKQGEEGKADLSYAYDSANSQFLVSVHSACSTTEPTFTFSPGQVTISKIPSKPGDSLEGTVSGAVLYKQSDYCSTRISKNVSLAFNVTSY